MAISSPAQCASERAVFDPFDPRWSTDPFPLYEDLRERAPIHRNEMGFWVVSTHAECLAVLRDRRNSADRLHVAPERFRRPIAEENPMAAGMVEMRPFLFRDPPDHTRLRGLVAQAFTPKVVESLRDRTQLMIDELLDAALEAGEVDLLSEFAYPLPMRVVCELLGVPAEDQSQLKVWSEALARGMDPDFLLSDDVITARATAAIEFARYFSGLMAERRRVPADDLLSALVRVEDGGNVLSETEILSTCTLLFIAGHETTVSLISGGVLALLRHPDQREQFCSEPGIRRSAVEEILRYVSPVQLTGRAVTEKCTFGGVEFDAGEFVLLLLASANRDPKQFENAASFDITRSPNNHLGFGFGIHHCLGSPLARMQTELALASLFQVAPQLSLTVDDVSYKPNVVLRGMESLPVSLRG